jgi:hypothetical protein
VGSNAAGKTLAKSRLIPAMPNPRFDLSFQLDNPENVPRQAALVFEIRSSGKEVLAARRITLQDMLSGGMVHMFYNFNFLTFVTVFTQLLYVTCVLLCSLGVQHVSHSRCTCQNSKFGTTWNYCFKT